MADILNIAQSLELAREARGDSNKPLSKAAASREIGVSRLTYDMWERGAWVPQVEQSQRIADFTQVEKSRVLEALLRLNGVLDDSAELSITRRKS